MASTYIYLTNKDQLRIVDLKPYLGEEDELELRMTQFQEGEDNEDITPSDGPGDSPTVMKGLITRARMTIKSRGELILKRSF